MTARIGGTLDYAALAQWQPGRRVLTESDYQEWQAWRKQRTLEAQRHRRATLRRIDYYPSSEAAAVIDAHTYRRTGGAYGDVIDRLVLAAVDEIPE